MSSVCHGLAYISTDFTGDSPSRLPFRARTSRLTDRQDATENSSQSIYQLSPTTENIVLFKSYCPRRHRNTRDVEVPRQQWSRDHRIMVSVSVSRVWSRSAQLTDTHRPARPLYQDYCKTVVPAWCWCAGEACTVRRMTGSIRC